MIKFHGTVSNLNPQLIAAADSIKLLNYKTTTPTKFQKRTLTEDLAKDLMDEVAEILELPRSSLDYVYFSACNGAEPHVDQLDPEKFTDRTFVIPVILPSGVTTIYAEDQSMDVELGGIYEFNHEKIHSMSVEDTESGCVVIMVAITKI